MGILDKQKCYTRNDFKRVEVGNDQEKARSEKDSHSKKPRWETLN